jgi:hypothetical protein
MRNPERIDNILKQLEVLWKRHPDMRMGQLFEFINLCRHDTQEDFYYVEDEEWKEVLNWLNAKNG